MKSLSFIFLTFVIGCQTTAPSYLSRDASVLRLLSSSVAPSPNNSFGRHLGRDLLRTYSDEVRSAELLAKGTKNSVRAVHQRLKRLNEETLHEVSRATREEGKHDFRRIVEEVRRKVATSGVFSDQVRAERDPYGSFGFCFGFALGVHYGLLKAGVPPGHIARLYLIGDLEVVGKIWRFHTVVLVRDFEHGYIAVDPLLETWTPYRKWISEALLVDIKREFSHARVYFTDPRKVLPASGVYSEEVFYEPQYKGFFPSLISSMED